MRRAMRDSLKETVQGLMDIGIKTTFTQGELNHADGICTTAKCQCLFY